jgi:type I pantothenate kinase
VPSLAHILDLLRARRPQDAPYVIAVTGSVAVGKSVLSNELAAAIGAWPGRPTVAIAATDGFLMDNARLEAKGLSTRKGFPESYDLAALRAALAGIRQGPVLIPGYSHTTYDIDAALSRTLARPDVLIVEGLGLQDDLGADASGRALIDALVYLDADEADIERWFTARLVKLMLAAADDPTSFYARFLGLDDAGRLNFCKVVWEGINRPNLREHISRARDRAELVIRKRADHTIERLGGRWLDALPS